MSNKYSRLFEPVKIGNVKELNRLGVNIHFNTTVSSKQLLVMDADTIICATGSCDYIPPIDGINHKQVVTAKQLMGGAMVGDKVAVIGSGLVGCEVAISLRSIS
ncbi:FAD-dependent oxidoreductase [Desulfosporosinus orientis]|uniref:FAD-dependent oxidoreductase n=1 Tax=Desulfosporosinus orientis TaxID=1563 RepID=UPI0005A7D54A|nr:FAD-dependent oxidoreductase [Desulfosporosinus orientis]